MIPASFFCLLRLLLLLVVSIMMASLQSTNFVNYKLSLPIIALVTIPVPAVSAFVPSLSKKRIVSNIFCTRMTRYCCPRRNIGLSTNDNDSNNNTHDNNNRKEQSINDSSNNDINTSPHQQQQSGIDSETIPRNTQRPQQRRRQFLQQQAVMLISGLVTTQSYPAVAFTSSSKMSGDDTITKPTTTTTRRATPSISSSSSSSSSSAMRYRGLEQYSMREGGLAQRFRRGICYQMDELQRDLMQEQWELLGAYNEQLRSYVTLFTTYTDAAFPTSFSRAPSLSSSGQQTQAQSALSANDGVRVALRYEVGRYYGALNQFTKAAQERKLDEAYTSYADMSLHLDRYLRLGGLYTYLESTDDNARLYEEYKDALVYADPVQDPADVRDLIVLCDGRDMGRTGIVIAVSPATERQQANCVVKLDRYRGMREIRVVPRRWAAKRLGEQLPDDVFLIPRT